jgi:hypothetical protein
MTEQQELKGVCSAGWFRITAFIVGICTNALVYLLIFLSPHLHPKDKGLITDHEPRAVAFSAVISISGPFLALFGLYFSFQKLKLISTELMFKLQAWVSLLAVIGICLFTLVYLSCVILVADYQQHPGPGGLKPANEQPHELSFSFRADELFLWVGGFLQVALAMGLLSPSSDAVYPKPPRRPRTRKPSQDASPRPPQTPDKSGEHNEE